MPLGMLKFYEIYYVTFLLNQQIIHHWKFFLELLNSPHPSSSSDPWLNIKHCLFKNATKHHWIILFHQHHLVAGENHGLDTNWDITVFRNMSGVMTYLLVNSWPNNSNCRLLPRILQTDVWTLPDQQTMHGTWPNWVTKNCTQRFVRPCILQFDNSLQVRGLCFFFYF